jgi:hypothetical protein
LALASAKAAFRPSSRPLVGSETTKLTPETVLAPALTAALEQPAHRRGSSLVTVTEFVTW